MSMPMPFPFDEPENCATFTTRFILEGLDWIGLVFHDAEDGTWQFHSLDRELNMKDAAIMSLGNIVRLDPSVEELADLPRGWKARRTSKSSPWVRSPIEPNAE